MTTPFTLHTELTADQARAWLTASDRNDSNYDPAFWNNGHTREQLVAAVGQRLYDFGDDNTMIDGARLVYRDRNNANIVWRDDPDHQVFVWTVDDVQEYIETNELEPTTLEQQRRVLYFVRRYHSAECGVSWDTIAASIEHVREEIERGESPCQTPT